MLNRCHPIGVPFRAINRPGSQLLGANGRDDGPIVSFHPDEQHFFIFIYDYAILKISLLLFVIYYAHIVLFCADYTLY